MHFNPQPMAKTSRVGTKMPCVWHDSSKRRSESDEWSKRRNRRRGKRANQQWTSITLPPHAEIEDIARELAAARSLLFKPAKKGAPNAIAVGTHGQKCGSKPP